MSVEIWLWGAAAIGGTVGLGYLGNQVMFARMKRRWKQVASDLGLTFEEAIWRMRGIRDGLYLEVSRVGDGSWDARMHLRGKAPLSLLIRPRTFSEPPDGSRWDPDFDRHFVVEGESVHAQVLLSSELRRAWVLGHTRRWTLYGDDEGWLLEARFSMELVGQLRHTVTEGLAFGRQIATAAACFTETPRHAAFAQALVERLSDPAPRVREKAARTLSSYLEGDPEVAAALNRALVDPDPLVRLQAALVLRSAKVLAEIAEDSEATTAARLEAFRSVVALAPHAASTRELVHDWALDRDAKRRLEAIQALARVTTDVEAWSLEILAEVELAPDETSLIELFSLLATHGTARSVPRLAPYRDRLLGSDLKDAARDAILAIQARAGGSTGALALSHGGGGLSEPE